MLVEVEPVDYFNDPYLEDWAVTLMSPGLYALPWCRETVVNIFKTVVETKGLPDSISIYGIRQGFGGATNWETRPDAPDLVLSEPIQIMLANFWTLVCDVGYKFLCDDPPDIFGRRFQYGKAVGYPDITVGLAEELPEFEGQLLPGAILNLPPEFILSPAITSLLLLMPRVAAIAEYYDFIKVGIIGTHYQKINYYSTPEIWDKIFCRYAPPLWHYHVLRGGFWPALLALATINNTMNKQDGKYLLVDFAKKLKCNGPDTWVASLVNSWKTRKEDSFWNLRHDSNFKNICTIYDRLRSFGWTSMLFSCGVNPV